MTSDVSIEEKFRTPFYSMAKCIEMMEVPLLIMSPQDQLEFLPAVASLLGGTVVAATAGDALEQIASSIAQPGYMFLVIDDIPPPEVHKAVFDYLDQRTEDDGQHEIHTDHRLVLIVDRSTMDCMDPRVGRQLRERATVTFVS